MQTLRKVFERIGAILLFISLVAVGMTAGQAIVEGLGMWGVAVR